MENKLLEIVYGKTKSDKIKWESSEYTRDSFTFKIKNYVLSLYEAGNKDKDILFNIIELKGDIDSRIILELENNPISIKLYNYINPKEEIKKRTINELINELGVL